ncbi:MAG: DUF6465 family protein [Blautia sp.]|uniref:DUF6465 family protein n=1 Tax=Blautia sp. TaxID=1955243 RepID=UPI002A7552E2|nr:DUF6465 family protein [Blautia sp.]MDY3018302.1 DUF6465 family protein [Blautia sp.]
MATRTTTKKAEPKTTTAKTAIEKEAPAKIPVETVTVSAVKETMETTPVKKAAAAKKTAVKTTAKKTAEKKQTVRKTVAKKAAPVNTEVYVQFWGKEVYAKDVVESIKKIWTEEMGKKESELKDLKVYIKPEDNGAHYVINGDITGFLGL